LALGVDRVEGKARLTGAREPGDDDQGVARQLEGDVLEVVLARTRDADAVVSGDTSILGPASTGPGMQGARGLLAPIDSRRAPLLRLCLRKVLRAAEGEGGMLSAVALAGATVMAVGAAIDATISFTLAETADNIEPTAVQALQALWDNDFRADRPWSRGVPTCQRHLDRVAWGSAQVARLDRDPAGRDQADADRFRRLRRRRSVDPDRERAAVAAGADACREHT
jgi:hypothetical protein